jgi:hypothetical protein
MNNAGRALEAGDRPSIYPIHNVGSYISSHTTPRAPTGWSNASTIVLSRITAGDAWRISLNPLLGYENDPSGLYAVLPPPSPPAMANWNSLPTELTGSAFRAVRDTLTQDVSTDEYSGLYRYECVGRCGFSAPLGSFRDETSSRPPEAMVLRRRSTRTDREYNTYRGYRTLNLYMRPVDPTAVATLRIAGLRGKSGADFGLPDPTYFHLTDSAGATIAESSLWTAGARPSMDVVLDPSVNPLPWHFYSSSGHGPELYLVDGITDGVLDGPEELLLGVTPEDIDAIAEDLSATLASPES